VRAEHDEIRRPGRGLLDDTNVNALTGRIGLDEAP